MYREGSGSEKWNVTEREREGGREVGQERVKAQM